MPEHSDAAGSAGSAGPAGPAGSAGPAGPAGAAATADPAGPAAAPGTAGTAGSVTERVNGAAAGLAPLVARAEAVWRERAAGEPTPDAVGWNQVFPSQFQEFTNRPR